MQREIIIHADQFENEKEFIEQEIEKNLDGKMNSYIASYLSSENDTVRVEIFLDRTNHTGKGEFSGKIIMTLPQEVIRAEREDFKKLDDLISHLFTHLKTQLVR